MPQTRDQLITVGEAAQILGRPAETVRRLVRTGVLSAQKLPGTHPRLLRTEVELLARAALVRGAISGQLAGTDSITDFTTAENASMMPISLHDPVTVTDLDGGRHQVLVSAIEDQHSPTTAVKFASVGARLSPRSSRMLASWIPFSPTPKPGCWSPIAAG